MSSKKKPAANGEPEASVSFTVKGWDAKSMQAWIAEHVAARAAEFAEYKVDRAIKEAAARAVQDMADKVTQERVEKEVARVLEEGWGETTTWGEATGKRYTVRDRVRASFDTKADSYDRQTRVEKWIHEGVTRTLEAVLKAEVEDARKRLRAAFDDVLKLKFADTMRKMLGVEPTP